MKHLILFVTFSILQNSAVCQWTQFATFNIPPSGWSQNHFEDADFASVQMGIFTYSTHLSMSSGTSISGGITNDSGNTWSVAIGSPNVGNDFVQHFSVPHQNTIYSVGNYNGHTVINKIYNPGLNIKQCLITGSNTRNIYTNDTSYFYIIRNDVLLKYSNGVLTSLKYFSAFKPFKVCFSDSVNGIIIGDSTNYYSSHSLIKTSDGGISWSNVFTDTTIQINAVHFADQIHGFAVADYGKILKTVDSGNTWSVHQTQHTVDFRAVFFINDTIGFAAGDSGTIIRTCNAGISWTKDSLPFAGRVYKLTFLNDSIGIAIAGTKAFIINLNQKPIIQTDHANSYLLFLPNPASGEFVIQYPSTFFASKILILDIYDMQGKNLNHLEVLNNTEGIKIESTFITNGIYLVSLCDTDRCLSGRLMTK